MRPKGSFVLAATMLENGKRVRGVGSQPFSFSVSSDG
jgi:hypothetical protein